jgi:hypothetical protein
MNVVYWLKENKYILFYSKTKSLLPKTKPWKPVTSSNIFGKRCAQFTKAIRIGDDTDDSFVIVLQLLGGEVWR